MPAGRGPGAAQPSRLWHPVVTLSGAVLAVSVALGWLDHHRDGTRLTAAGLHAFRPQLPGIFLLVNAVLLGSLGVASLLRGRGRPDLWASTAALAVACIVGFVAVWLVAASPFGEGPVVVTFSRSHSLTSHDVPALPLAVLWVVLIVITARGLWRAPSRGDSAVPRQDG
jgi:hypothetical protein